MSYVKQILFPEERVLYEGHVHPVVLSRGLFIMACAAFIAYSAAGTGRLDSWLLNFFRANGETSATFRWFYGLFYGWQVASPSISFEYKLVCLGFSLWGINHLSRAAMQMYSNELVVTDLRIIAKAGVFNIITLEMDRRRVAEVLVDQSFWGRILNFGYVYIRGFTGVIGGMPVLVNPHLIKRFITSGYNNV